MNFNFQGGYPGVYGKWREILLYKPCINEICE